MVISSQWGIWKTSNSERAQKVKALILNDSWWAHVQFVLDFTDPIMTMLYFADTDQPCLGDVYDGMDTIVEKVELSIQKHEKDPTQCEALSNQLETIILHHWEKMTTPLHLLACALSPRYYSEDILAMPNRVAPYADEEVANGCYKAFGRLFLDDDMHKKVASSSVAEWNWSTYSFIHSVKRNQLGSKKDEDLVYIHYIHTNLRLLSHKEDPYKEGAAKLWDVEPECANLDATIQDLTTIMDDDDNIMTHGSSSTSVAVLGSNDLELAAVGGLGDDDDFLENPYDSNLD